MNLVDKFAEKLSKEDLIDIVRELTGDLNDLDADYEILRATNAELKEQLRDIENDRSNAWAQRKQSQDRVGQLFGRLERIAHILNQTDDVDGVNDTQIIEQIVEVVENEIKIVRGEFVNHKGDKL